MNWIKIGNELHIIGIELQCGCSIFHLSNPRIYISVKCPFKNETHFFSVRQETLNFDQTAPPLRKLCVVFSWPKSMQRLRRGICGRAYEGLSLCVCVCVRWCVAVKRMCCHFVHVRFAYVRNLHWKL